MWTYNSFRCLLCVFGLKQTTPKIQRTTLITKWLSRCRRLLICLFVCMYDWIFHPLCHSEWGRQQLFMEPLVNVKFEMCVYTRTDVSFIRTCRAIRMDGGQWLVGWLVEMLCKLPPNQNVIPPFCVWVL